MGLKKKMMMRLLRCDEVRLKMEAKQALAMVQFWREMVGHAGKWGE
jgi:hypothetical protein